MGCAMRKMMLTRSDSFEAVLQTVEAAMDCGEECRICNIDYLGSIHTTALILLAKSRHLLDTVSGRLIEPKPGFCLIGIEESGMIRRLTA